MIQWSSDMSIYVHRDPVDFRKSINGLVIIVDEQMGLNALSSSLFVFCNKPRDKLKVLYWDQTGFALWYKRLEQDRFKWPRKHSEGILHLNEEQWSWLLRGMDISKLQPHDSLDYSMAN